MARAGGSASRTAPRPVSRLEHVSDLRSAPAPPLGDADHVRGDPRGAARHLLRRLHLPALRARARAPARRAAALAFRHFAIAAKHPRAVPLACAAEAAARQGRFWEFHDALFEDPAAHRRPAPVGARHARSASTSSASSTTAATRRSRRASARRRAPACAPGSRRRRRCCIDGTILPGMPDARADRPADRVAST